VCRPATADRSVGREFLPEKIPYGHHGNRRSENQRLLDATLSNWQRIALVVAQRRVVALCSVLWGLGTSSAWGLDWECPRLSGAERSELEARVELWRVNAKEQPGQLVLVCTAATAHWRGSERGWEHVAVVETSGLVEGALDALDARAQKDDETTAPTEPALPGLTRTTPNATELTSDSPFQAEPEYESTAPKRGMVGGGVGLAVAVEPWPAFETWPLGPRLDLAITSGSYAFSVSEMMLLSSTTTRTDGVVREYDLLLFQLAAAAGWGAPFVNDAPFGAQVWAGGAWLAAGGDPINPRVATRFVPGSGAGVRAAASLWGFAFWSGLDLGYRFGERKLAPPIDRGVPPLSVTLSLGAMALATPD
jgi:hypothetical protein